MYLKNYFWALLLFFCGTTYAGDWYIATTGDDATGDGSIGNPYATLLTAYTAASAGDIIHVAAGTYTIAPMTGNVNYIGVSKSMTILGDGAGSTIIQIGTAPVSDTDVSHGRMFQMGTNNITLTIEGITFRYAGWYGSNLGGGVFNLNASQATPAAGNPNTLLYLRRCNFIGNTARYGGGMQIANAKPNVAYIENCYFGDNMVMPEIKSGAYNGLGSYGGAAIHTTSDGSAEIKNCVFYNNNSLDNPLSLASGGTSTDGRAVNIKGGNAEAYAIVTNCTFIGNKAVGADPSINATAVLQSQAARPFTFLNNIVVDNTDASSTAATDLAITSTTQSFFDNFKGNVISKATIDAGITLDASNMVSDTYTGASTDVGIDGGSTPNIVPNSTGVKIVTAYGTKVVGMAVADATVMSTDINGATRGVAFSVGAVESIATKVSNVKNGLTTITVQNRIMNIKTEGVATIAVYNLAGAKVFAKTISGSETIRFDKAGLYLVRIAGAQGTETSKILVR